MRQRAIVQFIFISIAVILLSLLYFFFPSTQYKFYPKCPFYSLTGFDCPGCGSQRAFSALLHGMILRAIGYNLLFVLAIPFILYSAFVYGWNIYSDKKLQQQIFYSPVFTRVVLIAVIIFWIVRNIPCQPFTWFKA